MSELMTYADVDLGKVTPLMQQYFEVKNEYKDCILFYRLGDFYEMFFDDAITCSRELELTLTGKSCGLDERAPMCGIPFHSYEGYLTRLVEKGYRVAICEQVEDPKMAKGLVRREVIRIVTPGTNTIAGSLEEDINNYLMTVVYEGNTTGIAVVDISTGDFYLTECENSFKVMDEISRYNPKELVINNAVVISGLDIDELKEKYNICVLCKPDSYFDPNDCMSILLKHFNRQSSNELGIEDYPVGSLAAGATIRYLTETQKNSLSNLTAIIPYTKGRYMVVDNSARRNLELCETLREKNKRGSLLWVLDKTKTAMGARLLRSFVEQPLLVKDEIENRLDAVEELKNDYINREELREYLNSIYDLERLSGRISFRNANPRDLTAFATSLSMLVPIKTIGSDFKATILNDTFLNLDTLEDLYNIINLAINDDPPINIKEGGIIREGYNSEVDMLRNAKTEGKNWLAELEAKERDRTGIKNLRIKYNRVFGYYFVVTNSYKSLVPAEWIRKRTLADSENYTTEELKELEDKILNAEDRLFSLEYDLFYEIREKVAENIERIQATAKAVALIDVFCSLAYVAEHNGYVRPQINTKGIINISGGRHPVVEQFIGTSEFVDNDTYLDNAKNRIAIITGPNMAGKSTYMRQTALIVLMAQMGCFVPAAAADIGIVDRLFTRVGASDDLSTGQSTFMVEMNEVAQILKTATSNSLLILDEIGRGTSTFDGLAIAWAVIEYINDKRIIGAKTLFATHYHELTELEGKLESVKNYCIAVREQGENIIFLRKIIEGGADKSYGIQVARLAGLPEAVLARAREIVNILTDNDINYRMKETVSGKIAQKTTKKKSDLEVNQLSFFDNNNDAEVVNQLKSLDISVLTPIQALNKLYELQNLVKK